MNMLRRIGKVLIEELIRLKGDEGGWVGAVIGGLGMLTSIAGQVKTAKDSKEAGYTNIPVYGGGPPVGSVESLTSGGLTGKNFNLALSPLKTMTSPTTSDLTQTLASMKGGASGGTPLMSMLIRKRQTESLGNRMRGMSQLSSQSFGEAIRAMSRNLAANVPATSIPRKDRGMF